MSGLVDLRVVSTEFEADVVCGLPREADIECEHRPTNLGVGSQDGLPVGGPRVVLVWQDEAERTEQVLAAKP